MHGNLIRRESHFAVEHSAGCFQSSRQIRHQGFGVTQLTVFGVETAGSGLSLQESILSDKFLDLLFEFSLLRPGSFQQKLRRLQ
jgi:hypothetical protein